ncbi:hypothetical protein GCWU000341_02656 [Oribacterium sp. oral taxon 078 str. F0262]|nr:hypothetical protein GCWU000341_02656 [Oribacterium sp. oral taxon 078 str. F0262]
MKGRGLPLAWWWPSFCAFVQGKDIFFAKFIIVKPAKVRIIKNNRTPRTSQRCVPRGDILFCGNHAASAHFPGP